MATVKQVYDVINSRFPFNEAEGWDNSGLIIEANEEVCKILVSLDATAEVIKEAENIGANLIVCHHPVIFHPIKNLSLQNPAVSALKSGISIISAHTNFDVSDLGPDATLEKLLVKELGFTDIETIEITQKEPIPHGFGRIGRVSTVLNADEFAVVIKRILGADALRYSDCGKEIFKIGFCCGGGSDYIETAAALGCDAFITSDVKHSAFIDANNLGISVFAPTHYQMEKPAMKNMATLLKDSFPQVEIVLSQAECEPTKSI
jgi:dinuclear metal center YbgI/SA1388 family protein